MNCTGITSENWVFLGDSITEGVGSSRTNYITELTKIFRTDRGISIDNIRLRVVNPDNFNRFLQVNLAGYADYDKKKWLSSLFVEFGLRRNDSG